jgi:hypothetical protein
VLSSAAKVLSKIQIFFKIICKGKQFTINRYF